MSLFDMTASTNVRKLMVLNTEYPKDVTVKAGADAVFSAVIEKDGRPTEYTYKWYVNDIPVDNVNTAVYARKTDADKGVYTVYCEITNKAGVVKTRTATMTVKALPKLDSTKPADVSCNIGESKTVSVSISEHGYPKSYTYQWYKNGSKISGATGASYTFKPTDFSKTTLYCEVTNSTGTVKSRTATITVKEGYIYKNGVINTEFTGGLKGYPHGLESSTSYGLEPTITNENNNIKLFLTGTDTTGYRGVCYVENIIDLTNVNKISLNVTELNYSISYSNISLMTTKNRVNGFTRSASKKITATGEVSLDVSSLTGKHYVGIMMAGAQPKTIKISEWKLS